MEATSSPRTVRELDAYVEEQWAEYEKKRSTCPRHKRGALRKILESLQRVTAKTAEIKAQAKKFGYGIDDALPEKFPE